MTTIADSGITALENLREDGMPIIQAAARRTMDKRGVISQLCERHMLKPNTGTVWIEPEVGKLVASDISPLQVSDNPQQLNIVDVLKITPTPIAVETIMSDAVRGHISRVVYAQMGMQAQDAIQRKMDIRGIEAFGGAGKTYGSGSNAFDLSNIEDAVAYMQGNDNESLTGDTWCVGHRYHVRDITADVLAPVGNASGGEISRGVTADVFRNNFKGKYAGTSVFWDWNIPVSNNQAYAMVGSRKSIVCVNDAILRNESYRVPNIPYGATKVVLRSLFAYGLRKPTYWAARILADATAPS